VRFYCIADEDTVRGFRLAAVEGRVVTTPEEAAAALKAAAARKELDILIVTDVVASGIRTEVDAIRNERTRPLIVEVPGPDGPLPGRKSLRDFVQEAVGIRLGSDDEGENKNGDAK
jgi:V/A-type H+/Na+-transporting ATPase subunit F